MEIKQYTDEIKHEKTWTLTLEEPKKDHIQRSFNTIELKVYYTLGGMNYFTGTQSSRGYVVAITPCNIKQENGWTSRSMMLGAGAKTLVVPTQRKGKKAFMQALLTIDPVAEEILQKVANANVSGESFATESIYHEVLATVMA